MKLSSFVATVAAIALFVGVEMAAVTAPAKTGTANLTVPETFAGLPPDSGVNQYASRIEALGRNIPGSQQAALAAWMTGGKPPQFSAEQWLYLQNVVMDSLCQQTSPFPGLSPLLVGIATDKTADAGLRDYTLQHMAVRLQPMGSREPCETAPQKRQAMIKAMVSAAKDPTGDLAGTALEGLNLDLEAAKYNAAHGLPAAQASPGITAEALRPLAVKLATAPDSVMKGRMTALQVCAQQGYDEALPTARAIAADPKSQVPLRLSAIAAIGQLGNADDEALLDTLQNQHNPLLLKATAPALKKIKQRAALAQGISTR